MNIVSITNRLLAMAIVLRTKYYSVDQVDKNDLGVAFSMYEERRYVERVVVGKPEVRRPLGRPRCRLENNIILGIHEVEWGNYWIDLVSGRDRWRAFVKQVMNLRFP